MRILITNDDGIESPGIAYLALWAKKLGEVIVVAPKHEQSACSHTIVLRRPFEVKESRLFDTAGIKAYSIDASPADCVRFSAEMYGGFDLLLSGINHGLNMGYDISYSGTCSAAFEGSFANIPSVAFSTERGCLKQAAAELDAVWDFITENRLLDHGCVFNVNVVPDMKGIRITRQGATFYRDSFELCGTDTYKAATYIAHHFDEGGDPYIDINAVHSGYCSITPLRTNRTDTAIFEKLKK